MKNLLLPSLIIAAVAICFQADAEAQSGTRGTLGGGFAAPAAPMSVQSSVAPIQSQPIMMDKAMSTGSGTRNDHTMATMGDSHTMPPVADGYVVQDRIMAPAPTYATPAVAAPVQHCCPPSTAAPKKRQGFLSWLFRR